MVLTNKRFFSLYFYLWLFDAWYNRIHTQWVLNRFSCVWLFVSPRAVVCQTSLPMGFSRQVYWNRWPAYHVQVILLTLDWNNVSYISCIGRRVLYHEHHLGSHLPWISQDNLQPRSFSKMFVYFWRHCATAFSCRGKWELLSSCGTWA